MTRTGSPSARRVAPLTTTRSPTCTPWLTAMRLPVSSPRLTGRARAVDAVTIEVMPPASMDRVGFLARLEALDVAPGAAAAKVIVNSRTGTVVMGGQVSVLPAAVSHGSLTVSVTENAQVSQPNEFGRGQTVVTPQSSIEASQEGGRMFLFEGGTSLETIVRAVNAVGAAPGDIVAILEALKRAGALRAELEVI